MSGDREVGKFIYYNSKIGKLFKNVYNFRVIKKKEINCTDHRKVTLKR